MSTKPPTDKPTVEKNVRLIPPEPTRQPIRNEPFSINLVTPDAFVGVPEVIALDERVFKTFIMGKEATMVLFYDEQDDKADLAKQSLIKAVGMTKKDNHAFGAVNCGDNKLFCKKNWVFHFTVPVFKLYSGGHVVNSFEYTTSAKDIKKFVDGSPPPVPTRIFKKLCACVSDCRGND